MLKRLQIRRHTDKRKRDAQASQKGLNRVRKFVTDPDSITDVFCGPTITRVPQTALAACCAHGIRATVHSANSNFGTEVMLAGWRRKGIADKAKETGSFFLALKIILTPDEYEALQADFRHAIRDAFAKIKDDGHGLLFGNSPIVEAIADAFGTDLGETQLASCEGFMLEQDDDGNITVVEILKAA